MLTAVGSIPGSYWNLFEGAGQCIESCGLLKALGQLSGARQRHLHPTGMQESPPTEGSWRRWPQATFLSCTSQGQRQSQR